MSRLRKMLVWGGIFGLGWLLGPIFVAAASSLNASSDKASHASASYRLLTAFDDRYPQPIPMTSMDLGVFVRKCGYDENELFGPDDELAQGQKWSPRTGYFDLVMWHHDEFRRETENRRAEELGKHLSDYQLALLDRCLRQTAFASVCGEKVRGVLERGDLLSQYSLPYRQPRPDQTRRNQTICNYLDGVAARKGEPLGQWSKGVFEKPSEHSEDAQTLTDE